MKRALLLAWFLSQACVAQGEDPWKAALARIEGVHSYRLQVRSTHHHELPKPGSGANPDLGGVCEVVFQGPNQLRIQETSYSDGALRKASAWATVLYDGKFEYFDFHSSERTQKIKHNMAPWVQAGQPFQDTYPNWGNCFLEKQDYLGMIRQFAALTQWTAGPDATVNGKLCQTLECDIQVPDQLPVHYRAYLDGEGWLRGVDTWYPDGNKPVHLWRMRYQNIRLNPEIDASQFQVKNPGSYQLFD